MDLRQYLRVLRAHWWLIVLSLVLGTAAAAVLAWERTPTYAARTQMFVSVADVAKDPNEAYQGGLFAEHRVRSYGRLVSSAGVVRPVIRDLGLRESLRDVQGRVRASVPPGSVLINVTVRDHRPALAKAIDRKSVV
jgi:succinoglycan biosynthesis transport protein ExoP